MLRRDSLGRLIPSFDRSAAAKKGARTRLAKNPNAYSEMGKISRPTQPNTFERLKAEDPARLREIARKGGIASKAAKSNKTQSTE